MASTIVTYGTRACAVCNASFIARSSTSKTCSEACSRERKRAWSAAYHAKNRDKIAARSKAWHEANPERSRERSRRYEAAHRESRNGRPRNAERAKANWQAWYAANREIVIEKAALRAKANPESKRISQSLRRARMYGSGSARVTSRDLARLSLQTSGLCLYCGEAQGEHWDHRVPLARGGRHAIGNLSLACGTCNQQKHTKTVTEWRAWRAKVGLPELLGLTVL